MVVSNRFVGRFWRSSWTGFCEDLPDVEGDEIAMGGLLVE